MTYNVFGGTLNFAQSLMQQMRFVDSYALKYLQFVSERVQRLSGVGLHSSASCPAEVWYRSLHSSLRTVCSFGYLNRQ